MKNKLVFLLPILLLSITSCKGKKKNDDDLNKVHIIVLAGQSGARGKALVSDLTSDYLQESEDVDIFADGLTMDKLINIPDKISDNINIVSLKPGFGDYPSEFGPELGIGETLASRYHKANVTDYKNVIVKYTASGSTFLNHWYSSSAINDSSLSNYLDLSQVRTTKKEQKTGPLTNNLYQLIDKAIETLTDYGYEPVIDGMAFVHGEQDAKFDDNMTIYKNSLKHFVNDFRDYYGNQNIPVVVTEALTNSAKHSNLLREIQSKTAEELNNVSFVKTNDLYTNTFEPWHFDAKSNNILGNRIAADIISNNDNREITTIDESITVPSGVSVDLPQYVKASFTNYYSGYVKVNNYLENYNPNKLGAQNVRFNVKTSNGLVEQQLLVNVANDIAFVDGKVQEYDLSKAKMVDGSKGSICTKINAKGVYFAGNINDNSVYTDGEKWHEGDMGQKGNNDDLRIYLTDGEVSKRITVCLSSANLLRIYNNGISLEDSDKILEANNMVYKKKVTKYQSHVITKGTSNVEGKSGGLSFELYLPFDELGVTTPNNLKVCFNYNDVSSTNEGVRNNKDYHCFKNDYDGNEGNIENYFSINELI